MLGICGTANIALCLFQIWFIAVWGHIMSNKNVLGKLLKLFRESAGMSPENVADKIYKTPEDILQWESGKAEPSIYMRACLAILYNIPLNLLTYDFSNGVSAVINCRAVGDFRNLPDEYQFIFANKVDNITNLYALYNEDNNKFTKAEFIGLNQKEIDTLSYAKNINEEVKSVIRNKAVKLREHYGYKENEKATDFLKRVLENNVTIIFSSMPEKYSGLSFLPENDNNFFIFINSGDHYCKQTFTLLHEMAHVIFYKVENKELIEEFANYFANVFMLPEAFIRDVFKDFSVNNMANFIDEIKDISHDYEVTYKTILYSLRHLNLIKDEDIGGDFGDFVNKSVLKYFDIEYNVDKPSYRYNVRLNNIVKQLIEKDKLSAKFALQMNFGQPFIN